MPDFDLGGGRTLASLQWADLFGDTRADHTIRLISAILQILGRDPGVTTSAEETLDRRDAVAEAVTALREAVRLDPGYAYAHRRLGAALMDQGHYTEAEEAEREAIRLDPHNAFAHSRLGEALRLKGRLNRQCQQPPADRGTPGIWPGWTSAPPCADRRAWLCTCAPPACATAQNRALPDDELGSRPNWRRASRA